IYTKYRENKTNINTFMPESSHSTYTSHIDYCDTEKHTRVQFIDEDSYRNAEIGCTAIVIQFGQNKNNTAAFVLPEKR
ncbi:MAG: hypothetical protein K2H53_06055, partial [Clostridia bacterium]|nr:hypothetical protein [Clostridia bacterium]